VDWTVLAAAALACGYVGYVLGVLVRRRVVDGGAGGEPPDEPGPESPPRASDDFHQWELEVEAGSKAQA
jgi:hypothetical protein